VRKLQSAVKSTYKCGLRVAQIVLLNNNKQINKYIISCLEGHEHEWMDERV